MYTMINVEAEGERKQDWRIFLLEHIGTPGKKVVNHGWAKILKGRHGCI